MAHTVRKEGYSNGFQSIRSNLLDLNVSENCRCYPGHSGVIILWYTLYQYFCLTAFARNRIGTGLVQKKCWRQGFKGLWEGPDPQLADFFACSTLLIVDVRRQLVEARERAVDQDIVLPREASLVRSLCKCQRRLTPRLQTRPPHQSACAATWQI